MRALDPEISAGVGKKVIYAAVAGNFLIAITKFAAAAYAGSPAILIFALGAVEEQQVADET